MSFCLFCHEMTDEIFAESKNKGTLVFLPELSVAKCCTSGGMAAGYESSDTPLHLQYARHGQVSCIGCWMCRSHSMLTWTPCILCVLGRTRKSVHGTRMPPPIVFTL